MAAQDSEETSLWHNVYMTITDQVVYTAVKRIHFLSESTCILYSEGYPPLDKGYVLITH